MKKKIRMSLKGFTLVELLLVMAIIGILAGVLFVSLGGQRERARITAFKGQMRALVPSITSCIDAEGTLQDSTDGNAICQIGSSDAVVHGEYVAASELKNCNGDSADPYTVTVAQATGFEAELTATCKRASDPTTPCVASCKIEGCTFTDCE